MIIHPISLIRPHYNKTGPKSNPILAQLPFDTVSFTAKKKSQQVGKYDQKKLVKSFAKKGAPQQTLRSILDNPRKKEALAKFIEDYEEGKIKFSRAPREREIVLAIDNEFSYEQIQKFIDWQDNVKDENAIFSRPLKTKEAIVAIKEGATKEQIQRALTLSDKDKNGNTYLSRFLTFKEGLTFAQKNYTDEQAQIYIDLVDNNMYARDVVDDSEKYQRLLKLIKNSQFQRNLSVIEAAGVVKRDFTDEQVKRFIDLTDNGIRLNEENKDEIVKLTPEQVYVVVGNNLSEFQTYYYLKHRGDHSFFKIVTDENRLKQFLRLTGKTGEVPTTRPLKFSEATYILQSKEELSIEQIQTYIDLMDKKVSPHTAHTYITDLWDYKDKSDLDDLTNKQKRELLKKVMARYRTFFTDLLDESVFPLIPKNEEQSSIIVPKIATSIGIQTKELSQNELKTFYLGLNGLIQKIHGVDLDGDLSEIQAEIDDILVAIGEFKSTLENEKDTKETLKLLQQIVKSEEFQSLNKNDKYLLAIATLLHNINRTQDDRTTDDDCAFDAFYIIQKLNLNKVSQLKIYEIIKNQHWPEKFSEENSKEYAKTDWRYAHFYSQDMKYRTKHTAQNIAFETRHGNTYELVKILSGAIAKNNNENMDEFEKFSEQIQEYLKRILKTQIFLPQAKFPKASEIKNGEIIEQDGIKNVVLDLEKCDFDLKEYGFKDGTTKGNLYMLVHGLDKPEELGNFSAFSIVDSEALLSSSYMNPANHKVFRRQGIILDVHADDIHACYYKDFGSGTKKTLEEVRRAYIFPNNDSSYSTRRVNTRTYISNLVKEKLGLNDEEYIELIAKIKNLKSWTEIQKFDEEVAFVLKNIFDEMELGQRQYGREYNEVLISRPKIQAVFSYGQNYENIPTFLKKYAMDNDLPVILFGN